MCSIIIVVFINKSAILLHLMNCVYVHIFACEVVLGQLKLAYKLLLISYCEMAL